MSEGKHILDEKDKEIIDSCKSQIEIHINYLLERGVRPANIQIELEWHIKKLLKGD